ncbi:MAG: hypothetical protein MZU97_08060 [Bacillus subtilis]|nr:hypothetical protein [Bacillus subtilis]
MEGAKRVAVTRGRGAKGSVSPRWKSWPEERMSLLDSLKPRESSELPLVYVRDTVVFPHAMASPVRRPPRFSVGAVDAALAADKRVFVIACSRIPSTRKPRMIRRPRSRDHRARPPAGPASRTGVRACSWRARSRARLRKTVYRKEWLGALVRDLSGGHPGRTGRGRPGPGPPQGLRHLRGPCQEDSRGNPSRWSNKAEDPRRALRPDLPTPSRSRSSGSRSCLPS